MVTQSPSAEPVEANPAANRAAVRTPLPETTEQEISRLTWAVLDGRASPADRRRLADLVNAQHDQRRDVVRD